MSDQAEGSEKSKIKVVDRRRFDEAGEEREKASDAQDVLEDNDSSEAATASNQTHESVPGAAGEPVGGPYQKSEMEITFSSFLISLATQALMQMGGIKPPEGMDIPIDRGAAKQTIDILSMIQIKTKGNLDEEEVRLMEEILHNLRLSYVRMV